MNCIAIITARGGSKRIPRKNIRNFLGKPIITYPIQTALMSGIFSEVMVSTDDNSIREISVQAGASVPFLRSANTSNDYATTADVLKEVLEMYLTKGIHYEYACCIYPTAVLINQNLLHKGWELIQQGKFNVVLPVAEYEKSIYRSLSMNSDLLHFNYPEYINTRTQDLPHSWYDTGQFYFIHVDSFLSQGALFTTKTGGIPVDSMHCQDIDTLEDWNLAEWKYQQINEKT